VNTNKFFCSIVLLSSCLLASATGMAAFNYSEFKPQHVILSVGGGAAIASNFGQSKNFPIVNSNTDSFYNYTSNHPSNTVAVVDGFLGGEWVLTPKWKMQVGLDFNQASNFHDQGALLQGADLYSSNLYSYQYSVVSRQILVESKFLFNLQTRYHPYFLIGLGAALNTAYGFKTSVPQSLTFTRDYTNHQQTSVSYNLGLGVDIDATETIRFGIGYRFADRGHASLGNAKIDTVSVDGTLPQVHLYTNEIMGQLTLLI
jgi:opacity protein-like surface antigen